MNHINPYISPLGLVSDVYCFKLNFHIDIGLFWKENSVMYFTAFLELWLLNYL